MPRPRSTRGSKACGATLGLDVAAGPQAATALRRPAAARRARPRDRARAAGVPVRRAAVESRCEAARADARARSRGCIAQLGATMIYVTHDQVEAMTLGERIVVLERGVDSADRHADEDLRAAGEHVRRRLPRQSRDEPAARPAAAGVRRRPGGRGRAAARCRPLRGEAGQEIVAGVRPEDLHIVDGAAAAGASAGPSSWSNPSAAKPSFTPPAAAGS